MAGGQLDMITVEEARATAQKRLRSRTGEWAARLVTGEDLADPGGGNAGSGSGAGNGSGSSANGSAGSSMGCGGRGKGSSGGADDAVPATAPSSTASAVFSLGLRPPTEAQVLAERSAALGWVQSWRELREAEGRVVDWESRAWARVGRQSVPVRLRLADPWAVADFAGGGDAAAWRVLAARARTLRRRWVENGAVNGGFSRAAGSSRRAGRLPAREGEVASREDSGADPGGARTTGRGAGIGDRLASALRANRAALVSLEETDFRRVLDAAEWLSAHSLEHMRPRQLPIRGVDSKWFTAHRKLVSALFGALSGGRRLEVLDPEDRVRLRILDPAVVAPGVREGAGLAGLSDIAAPVEEVAALPLRPRFVLVSENLETMLALPRWEGAVTVHGSGYAVSVLGGLPWLRDVPILYWGDLDSHGFAILHGLRSALQQTASVLMDEDTLMAHRDLWVREDRPHRGTFGRLTGQEQRALSRVRSEGDVRLEQERIPWAASLEALREAAADLQGRGGERC